LAWPPILGCLFRLTNMPRMAATKCALQHLTWGFVSRQQVSSRHSMGGDTLARGNGSSLIPAPLDSLLSVALTLFCGVVQSREAVVALTGRFNFKRTWRSRLTFVIEEEYQSFWGGEKRRWRRATLADLAEPEMRPLVDLRFQRQFRSRAAVPVEAEAQPNSSLPDTVVTFPTEREKRTT